MADLLKNEAISQCTEELIAQKTACKAPNDKKTRAVTVSDNAACTVKNVGQVFDLAQRISPSGLTHKARITDSSGSAKVTVYPLADGKLQNYGSPNGIYYGILAEKRDLLSKHFLGVVDDALDGAINTDGAREHVGHALAKAGITCVNSNQNPKTPLLTPADVDLLAKAAIKPR